MKYLFMILILLLVSCDKFRVQPDVQEVVITIDDAPNFPNNTIKMLDVLKRYNVQATMFCIGYYLKESPELATKIAKEQTLANHTMSHLHINEVNIEDIYNEEIVNTQNLIDSINIANNRPLTMYFRAPYGAINSNQMDYLTDRGYKVTWWDIDGSDWSSDLSLETIMNDIHNQLVNTDSEIPILLFHLSDNSSKALEAIIKEFNFKNIKIISLEERAKILDK